MIHIVLVHPEIPPNTGNVIRLAANVGCELHLIEPLGFRMDDPLMKRAGLDYREYADVRRHASWAAFIEQAAPAPSSMFAFTTHGSRLVNEVRWPSDPWLVFGSEGSGLPATLREGFASAQRIRLPMRPGQRSLNLSNAVAVAVFDVWRQCGYDGGV